MKKLPLFITIGILVAIGGYFIYQKYIASHTASPWDFVPANTVAVYEASHCTECITTVRNSSLWAIVRKAAFYDAKQDSIEGILSFLTNPKSGSLASLHITKKDDFDFIFYVPMTSPNEKKLMEIVVDEWKKKKSLRFTERVFNTIKIQELAFKEQMFSWVVIDDMWIGSLTSFLIEDVVRTIQNNDSNFRSNNPELYQLSKLKNDAGNLYVNLKTFTGWLTVFAPELKSEMIRNFGKSALLDVKAENESLILNGFSLDNSSHLTALSIFRDQSPTPFELKHLVSNRTVLMTAYGISSGNKFAQNIKLFSKRNPYIRDTLSQLAASLKFQPDELYASIKNEMGVCLVESNSNELSKILMIKTEEPHVWLNSLNSISEQLSTDTIFYEQYGTYEIRELPLFRFPEKLFWPLAYGFDQSFYTVSGETVILGENLEALKLFLEDIDREETWGKSVSQNKFLESTLLESNVSMYVNTSHVWNILSSTLHPKWTQFILDHKVLLNSVGMGAIQFSNLNESFYTNVAWFYNHVKEEQPTKRKASKSIVTSFSNPLIGKPFVVRSHVDKTDEVFLQDSIYHVHLVSAAGKSLWNVPLDGPITGEVFQIDYFRNGKLQYFFTTKGQLHVIDRLGKYVQPYPLRIDAIDVEHVSLIDYDHSKKYRFLITEQSGKMWMYDKEGNNLEGWKPRNVDGPLFTAPQHHRIRGKDYLLTVRRDGNVYLMNRRGELLPQFPLNLNARPTGDYHLEIGNSLATTNFVVVSRDGYRIKFNLEGKIQSRETLLKNSIDAQFRLVREHSGKSYVVARQESKRLTVLDKEGKEILVNDYIGLNAMSLQYYDFGAGKIFYAVTDQVQNLTFIYDARGTLLISPPLESDFLKLKNAASEQIKLYYTYQNALTVQSLP